MSSIPANITAEFLQEWVRPRVSPARFAHIVGVVQVAKRIGAACNCDVELCELAAWLHDACKEVKSSALVKMARDFGVAVNEVEATNGHLLHGPVAAAVARNELSITHKELLDAVAEHTLGNVPMTPLSEVLFLADCLESSRPESYTGPIWQALNLDGNIDVAGAMLVASDLNLMHLLESKRVIHPRSVEVRNHYLDRCRELKSAVTGLC